MGFKDSFLDAALGDDMVDSTVEPRKKEQRVDQNPVAAEWVLRAMISMASIDGDLDEREVRLIRQTYRELSAKSLDPEAIAKAAEANAKSTDVLAEMAEVAPLLSIPSKEEILRAAYFILLADGRVADAETQRMRDIATALDVTESEFEAILENVAFALARRGRQP